MITKQSLTLGAAILVAGLVAAPTGAAAATSSPPPSMSMGKKIAPKPTPKPTMAKRPMGKSKTALCSAKPMGKPMRAPVAKKHGGKMGAGSTCKPK